MNNLQYNRLLINDKNRLINELREIESDLYNQQNDCDHIRVCIGWNGQFQYKDTSICKCLLCRKNDPTSKYPMIDAAHYKEAYFSHGEISYYREERMEKLQSIAMLIRSNNPDITNAELANNINNIVKQDIKNYENIRILSLKKTNN